MKSYEVIRAAVEEPGVKAVAAALRLSPAMVYKWCEPPAGEGESGASNPLDRVREMYELSIRPAKSIFNPHGQVVNMPA